MHPTWLTDLEQTLAQLQAKSVSANPSDISAIDSLVTQLTRSMDKLTGLSDAERSQLKANIPNLLNQIAETVATLSAESATARDKLQTMRLRLQASRSYQQVNK